ncbi:MAG: phosphoribosylformylglycinamidine synthase subunit PurQ, partial [Cyclobacterium sp.]|uniref:phosphoribosylformylglycinamidine synthase subunit PurQ n=1 Tax=Cyclobacterium sp. TaxID=1966343 RepID=UPI0039706B2C
NPNGSDHAVAGLVSENGRHLAIMPHIERSLAPWNWPYYPEEYLSGEVSPWLLAFINARNWVEQHRH